MTTTTAIDFDTAWDFGRFLAAIGPHDVTVGLCTCCPEPRIAVRIGGDNEEWAHTDDLHFAEMRHIHTSSTSSDCDGAYSRTSCYRIPDIRREALRPDYLCREPGEQPTFFDLWSYAVRHFPTFTAEGGSTIEVQDDRVRWSYRTDEGGGAGEAHVCGEPSCAHEDSTFRDYTAERAGY